MGSSYAALSFFLITSLLWSSNVSFAAFFPGCGVSDWNRPKSWDHGAKQQTTTTTTTRRTPSIVKTQFFGTTVLHQRSSKDWDAILSDEDDDDGPKQVNIPEGGPPVPQDMRYIPRNCLRQNQNFVAIRQAGGPTNDIYVRNPDKPSVFWFAGKIARVSDVSVQDAVARQWPMIETHAANLRPLELYPAAGRLEIWTAPGDSEMEVAYNRPNVIFEKMTKRHTDAAAAAAIKVNMIGFQGEVYESGEEGFRTWRLEDGSPARPEIQSPSAENDDMGSSDSSSESMRSPTAEEMEQIQKALEGKDINAIYKEQERRKREG